MNFPGKFGLPFSEGAPVSIKGDQIYFEASNTDGIVKADAIVIPDAHLLFSGDFNRSGTDLVISDEHQRHIVRDYFKGEKQAGLTSPEGATLSADVVHSLTGYTVYAQAGAPAINAAGVQVIGRVLKVSGSATVIRNGVAVELNIGDAVQKGDVVQTGSDSSVNITLIDGTVFGMASSARMVLNEMVYDPAGSSNSALFSLVQGTISFVAGQTAKNGNMRVETPVATMGIRGTWVLVEISSADGKTNFAVKAEYNGYTGSYELYDKFTGVKIGTVDSNSSVTLDKAGGQPVFTLPGGQSSDSVKAMLADVFKIAFPNANPQLNGIKGSSDFVQIFQFKVPNGEYKGGATFESKFDSSDIIRVINEGQPNQEIYRNAKATFSADSFSADQTLTSDANTFKFKIADQVHISDPDFGIYPFYDIPIPYVSGTALLVSATSSIGVPAATALKGFIVIDPATGNVSFDRLDFNFLNDGETATYVIQAQAKSGPDTATVTFTVTIHGRNDAPTIEMTSSVIAGSVTEDLSPISVSGDIATSGTVVFKDFDLADTHKATFVLKSSDAMVDLPGFAEASDSSAANIGTFALTSATVDSTTHQVTEALDTVNTASVSWTFTLNNNNTTLQSLAAGQTITQVYTITITDAGGLSIPQDVIITIAGTNDAPVIAAIAATTLDEQTDALDLTSMIAVAFSDVDLTDTGHTATITAAIPTGGVTTGLLLSQMQLIALVTPGTVTKASGSPAGSVSLAFSAPSTAFDYLAAGESLTLTYTVAINDLDGGITSKDFTVTIAGTNDAPVIAAIAATTLDEQTDALDLTSMIAVAFSDVDLTDTGHTATVTAAIPTGGVTTGLLLSQMQLIALVTPGTVTKASGSPAGSVSLAFSAPSTAFDYLAAGESLTLTYTVAINDLDGGITSKDFTVTIAGTDDAPVISVANPAAVTEGNSGTPEVTIVDVASKVTISDVDLSDVRTPYAGALAFDASNSTGPAPSGGLASLFTLDTLNGEITYDKAAFDYLAQGDHVVARFTFNVQSGQVTSAQTISITIDGVNDAPINTVTSAQTTNEDTAIIFSAANGNAISIADVDIGSGDATVTLAIPDGMLTLSGTTGLSFANGDGTADGTMTFTGKVSDINTALNGLIYKPNADFNGSADLTITTSDGALTDTDTIAITIDPVNDAPVISTAGLTITGSGASTIIKGVAVSDIDNGGADNFTVTTLTDNHGILSPSSGTGSLSAINTALSTGISYTPNNSFDTGQIELTVADSGTASDTVNFVFRQHGTSAVTLNSTNQKDVLIGGTGVDNFVFAAGSNHDTIVGFTSGIDHVDLSFLNITNQTNMAWLTNHSESVAGGTLVHLDTSQPGFTGPDHNTILIKSMVAANDFILHPVT